MANNKERGGAQEKKKYHTWEYAKRRPYGLLLRKDIVEYLDSVAKRLGVSRSILVEKILEEFVHQYSSYEHLNNM
jgi:hypothetical protein